ncbi:AAA family ATPase [Candidatus Lucifugimonas marina]|uniref:AAA domain-containing protein n=1 Tax=Candidatus Lucifugimonas marina TaxID=3038979 RepID=A0AAJ6CSM3_9CHLR|nr:AAA domain-containing protein [SAR202 cluster bacterium JH702]MDG0868806.1 AAA domain-containing protein [SAR202 cluster bacterium JH639]WFG35436.1 AAA domain-containing protein [SAR202 cluster bacterium JH545]WFG39383.1 AAA domain-containing protein [SAR202 cluster bacterium JH1073]
MDTIAPSEISSGNAVLDFTVGMPDDTMTRALADDAATIGTEVQRVVVTSPQTIQLSILGLLAEGHILLEDVPGVGKTLLGKTLSNSIDSDFKRIQFTPDLLPTDITGTTVFDMKSSTFNFVPGPIFSNIVLADEINRTGPRTQAALLEAMAEHQVSIEGDVMKLPSPFMVIATQNLSESHGTFPLPDSQKDRFMVSMGMGLPSPEQEVEILSRSQHGMPEASPVISSERIVEMREMVKRIEVDDKIRQYIVKLAGQTRSNSAVRHGLSPRGGAALQRAAQAWAAMDGRSYVEPQDVSEIAVFVIAHRLMMQPSASMTAQDVVRTAIDETQVPS